MQADSINKTLRKLIIKGMKAILSCLQYGVGHQTIAQPDNHPQNTSKKESVLVPGLQRSGQLLNSLPIKASSGDEGNSIIIPKPRKADPSAWTYWMNYMKMSTVLVNNLSGVNSSSSESSDGVIKSEGERGFPKLTKQERALKVERYLEKKRRKNGVKKIRYQYRQELAAKRIRFQGRFVKPAEAKDLIMQGVAVTVKDKNELTKLFEEDKDQGLLEKYNENLRKKNLKRIFKTTYDTSVIDRLSSGDQSSYSSNGSISSFGSGMSPLIDNMEDMKLGNEEKDENPEIEQLPILKL